MPTRTVSQLALDEQAIENDEVLTALESWQNAKDEAAATSQVAKEQKALLTALLDKLEVPLDGAIRIGRFPITRKLVPGHTVESFTTQDKEKIEATLVLD